MTSRPPRPVAIVATLATALAGLAGCRADAAPDAPPGGAAAATVAARRAADMIHAALAADRAVYSREIVNRLVQVQKVQVVDPEVPAALGPGAAGGGERATGPLQAREDWRSEHGKLPLPAQMFRMGAEEALEGGGGLAYHLLSPWPINQQNAPRTEVERRALAAVAAARAPTYATEALGDATYFVAVYPDVATIAACVACHNEHPDSPRRDFAVGDVMGGMVIRFPL